MKLLVLAVVLTIMQAAPPVPRKAPNKQATQGADNHKADKARHQDTDTSASAARQPSHQGNSITSVEKQKDAEEIIRVRELPTVAVSTDGWSNPSVILTGLYDLLTAALVIVGFFGVRYARKSLNAIKSQLGVMQGQLAQMKEAATQADKMIAETAKSAEAALLNAKAVIYSERPWIVPMVSVSRSPSVTWVEVGIPTMRKHEPESFGITLRFKNYGRTPARIVLVRDIHVTLKQGETLPAVPIYTTDASALIGDRIRVPDEEWAGGGVNDIEATLTREQFEGIDSGEQMLVYFGTIRYRDVLNPEEMHESRFCYSYSRTTGEFVLDGPAEYNKYT